MKTSQSIGNIVSALAAARGEFAQVVKDKTAKVQTRTGGNYTYDYADLGSIIDAIKAPLAKHKVMCLQDSTVDGAKVSTTTMLAHESGEWIESSPFTVTAVDDKPQSLGSACTYARRYSLQSVLNVFADAVEIDEDANQAQGNTATVAPRQQQVRAVPGGSGPVVVHEPEVAKAKAKNLAAEAEKALHATRVWEEFTKKHGADQETLTKHVRAAVKNEKRSKNSQGKWAFSDSEVAQLEAYLDDSDINY